MIGNSFLLESSIFCLPLTYSFTARIYSETTRMYYDHEGSIIVSIANRAAIGNELNAARVSGSMKFVYQAELVIVTDFSARRFKVVKNRYGVDGSEYRRGIDLGVFLIGRGLGDFDLLSRERITDKIFKALADITGWPKEYIKNRERFILEFQLKPKYNTKKFTFA